MLNSVVQYFEPAAAVAVASLFTAVAEGRVPRNASVLLNITGGGRARMARDHTLRQAEPHLRVRLDGSHGTRCSAPSGTCSTPGRGILVRLAGWIRR
ncbi:cysteate synthase [Streptomyces badius]